MRLIVGLTIALLLLMAGAWFARDYVRRHPQDVPWTKLDLSDPAGRFTRSKLIRLGDDPGQCRGLLATARTRDIALIPRRVTPDCGYDDGIRLSTAGTRDMALAPAGLVTSCPVAAALFIWERSVVQPAAQLHFGVAVTAVDHAGAFSCRRLYGRSDGPFSEHATANAVDITGFRLADGRRVAVLRDWQGTGPGGAFLREVRTGACDLFATVLSPDYNAAHRDHLHLDQADRGDFGWRACR